MEYRKILSQKDFILVFFFYVSVDTVRKFLLNPFTLNLDFIPYEQIQNLKNIQMLEKYNSVKGIKYILHINRLTGNT